MGTISEKAVFLQHEYTPLLATIGPHTPRLFGKMDVQQMIEHMGYSFKIANGRDPHKLVNKEELVPRMQEFLRSDKPFRENTPNALLGEEPLPYKFQNTTEAISALQQEIDHFFEVFAQESGQKIMNPFFGDLDYELQIQLMYKHAWHHLRQFGVQEEVV
jgi:hypothetical protein